MQNYQNVARSIKLCFIKILPLTCSVIKKLRIVRLNTKENVLSLEKIRRFLNQRTKVIFVNLLEITKCLQKSINANNNQQGARYVNCTKKYHCVSTDFGEVK